MKLKLSKNKLINAEVLSPEMVIAEFNNDLTNKAKIEYTETLNLGYEFVQIYKEYKKNMHITNTFSMLLQLDGVFNQWENKIRKK